MFKKWTGSAIISFVFLAGYISSPTCWAQSNIISWNFDSKADFEGWGGKGILAKQPGPGVIQLRGNKEFQLFSPGPLKISTKPDKYLRVRLRSETPRYLRAFFLNQNQRAISCPEAIQIPFDRNYHTFWIPLTSDNPKLINLVGFVFGGHPGWVELDFVQIRPFSLGIFLSDQLREFWRPRRLHPGTINSLSSPTLMGKPFIHWLNYVAVGIIILGLILYLFLSQTKRKRIIPGILAALLFLWIIYDTRESYNQFKVIQEVARTYILPPPLEKTFPGLGDFYRFVSFCRENIPQQAIFKLLPDPYWPFDCRLRYFLYPSRIETNQVSSFFQNNLPKYFIVYQSSEIIFENETGRLISPDRKIVYCPQGKLVARYSPNSFIYKAEQKQP